MKSPYSKVTRHTKNIYQQPVCQHDVIKHWQQSHKGNKRLLVANDWIEVRSLPGGINFTGQYKTQTAFCTDR